MLSLSLYFVILYHHKYSNNEYRRENKESKGIKRAITKGSGYSIE
jgi:hypothetical protein